MKNFNGTKGEWTAHLNVLDSDVNSVLFDFGTICTIDRNIGLNKKDADANIKIIASAPDMLQALISLENENNSIPKPIWDKVQNAIEKALG